MPKKIRISTSLPNNFEIKEVIGPKEVAVCANGGHVLTPAAWVGAKVYIVKGVFGTIINANLRMTKCDWCGEEKKAVNCKRHNMDICRACCDKCRDVNICPEWKEE